MQTQLSHWLLNMPIAAALVATSAAAQNITLEQIVGIVDANVSKVALDPHDSNTLYVATFAGVFKSTDQAKNWYAINEGLPPPIDQGQQPPRALSVAVHPRDSQTVYVGLSQWGVFKSTNGGDQWEPTSNGGVGDVHDIAIDWKNPERVHAGGGGLYNYMRSDNGGQDWSNQQNFFAVTGIAVDPSVSNILYLSLRVAPPPFGGVAKTDDGGDDWSRPETGLPRLFAQSVAVDPKDTNTVYLGFENGGLYVTTNAGELWAPTGLQSDLSVWCLAIDPSDSKTLYAGTTTPRIHRSILKSTDRGETWYPANEGIGERTTSSLAIDPLDSNVLYAATSQGLFKSTDGAKSWFLTGG